MPEVQIGSFGRPGIYIREFDDSVIETPIVEGIQNAVLGFAKKGPFNTPVVINNQTDLESIFGPIDRRLERKGSFFHRTISKLLDSNPVIAINLLLTDDNLDTLDYQSFSTSTKHFNDVKRNGPYSRFFDRSGFWRKDTDAFNTLANEDPNGNERILNFTNMGEKPITIFTFKSTQVGFDVDMVRWYGNPEEIPLFVYPTDYVSDYMVDVLVLAGDWTNYQQLAVDSRWGDYFNPSGLIKSELLNFINDPASSVVSYYQGLSLIPYFRDGGGRDIFIENVINRDTDKNGLFCAYDIDAIQDTDFPTGLIDLIGNNLISTTQRDMPEEVNFLSYKDVISEKVTFESKLLDVPGNVLSFGDMYKSGTPLSPSLDRSAFYAENHVYGVTPGPTSSSLPISASFSGTYTPYGGNLEVDYTIGANAYVVIGGQDIELDAGTEIFTIDPADYSDANDGTNFDTSGGTSSDSSSYKSTVVVDNTGTVKMINNMVNNDNPSVSSTDVVLGYVDFDVINDGGTKFIVDESVKITHVSVDTNGFVELQESTDFLFTSDGNGELTWEFIGTAQPADPNDYEIYRRFKMFNNLINYLNGPNKDEMTLLIDGNIKASLESMSITDIQTLSSVNKAFTLVTGLDENDMNDIGTGSPGTFNLTIYIKDDEFILGTDSLLTTNSLPTTQEGIVAKHSDFYEKYRDGIVNTKDFFYKNLISTSYNVDFVDSNGFDYIVFEDTTSSNPIGFNSNDRVVIPESTLNGGVFTISDNSNWINDLLNEGVYGSTTDKYAFRVVENTSGNTTDIKETVTGAEKVWDANDLAYLQMYFNNSGILSVEFKDQPLQSPNPIDITNNIEISVVSQKTNFQQTVEIETPAGYIQVPNKILVDGQRFIEVKIGDYLLADIDESQLEIGEVPKRITRIISKKLYPANTDLVEITCDASIKKYDFNGDLQTTRFTKIDDYVNIYKGFRMSGFKVKQTSIPDGTEERQNDILNLVEKGTNMYKAVTDKDNLRFRYLIDSFGNGLTEFSKQQLVDICGERLDCFGFINMPSMKQFKNSTSPSFVDDEGVAQTELIRQGGDPESNPAFLYSFAEGTGVTSVGYFTPYLSVNDNGRPLNFPPAAYVASTYLRKFNTTQTNIRPWTISAGVTNGQITGIAGLEKDFNGEDIINFNQMKANPIVSKRNRGFVIETENTAQTFVRSALSFIHVREVLIEIEQELSAMLLNFQWKFNTPEIRAEIKLRADNICEKYVNQNGLFNFFNKIDSENNTEQLIDNQIGVLDTYLEPTKGLGIIVNNITITSTGGIASSGFA